MKSFNRVTLTLIGLLLAFGLLALPVSAYSLNGNEGHVSIMAESYHI